MLEALGKYILVKPIIEEKKEKPAIILMKDEQKITQWEVYSVGLMVTANINPGDTIFIQDFRTEAKEIDGVKYYLALEEAVYAIKHNSK